MSLYRVAVEVYVEADSPEEASSEVFTEAEYLTSLDNMINGCSVAPLGVLVGEE